MRIIKTNVVLIEQPTNDVLTFCKKSLTFENPKFINNQKLGVSNFATSRNLYYYTYNPETDTLIVPIGFWQKYFHFVESEDLRTDYYSEEIEKLQGTYTLRTDQLAAVEEMQKYTNGILSAPTASGKTLMALELILRLKRKTLFLVHTKELAKQFQDRVETFLGYKVGLIGTGRFELTDIAVGILQTLIRLDDSQIKLLNKTYGYIIADEVHIVGLTKYI